ncbi:patatin-like phospholipase family protein [Marivirga sp. S37H4]|uniref:Patatin-like phospholipase family protein n=1 Tax=Marivirga aurantiaca TaxID=2802615 RepID=A0A934X1L5_9BACT|nr:patatin-like phospholipase family protein [Marivirga aurantiaca]MBK6266645.1 patatin-like phospholipase family protein [Marivirga aurantiaca]
MPSKFLAVSLLILLFCTNIKGQKVGLVLSGGGAKGLAHIGVLKALEENNIPIDYIVGTSMGGIIGGMYAAGFTPDEIDSIATSPEFLKWVNGEIPDQYQVYYLESDPVPKWLEVNLGVDSTFDAQFNPKLANDLALNFALAENMAAANQVANADFSQLFVPFTAIGAELFTQKTVLLDSGNLGASMRATMSVPFVYRPIRINGQYIFDGGIYNNFPVEPMKESYNPDKIIGVNVSAKVYETYPAQMDQKLISSSLLYMMMDKADPGSLGEDNFYIEPNLEGFSGFKFKGSREIIDSGYVSTMKAMPDILAAIERRSDPSVLKESRLKFKKKQKPLIFSGISFEGFEKKQEVYIRKVLSQETTSELSIDNIRANYYQLVAEPYFSDIFPEIKFDYKTQKYIFSLYSDKNEKIRLQLGGNIATGGLSNIFFGAKLDVLGNWLYSHNLNGRIGEFYKSFQYNLRINIPSDFPFYLEPYFIYNSWNYLGISSFLTDRNVTDIVQFDRNYGINFAFPLRQKFKINLKSSFLQKNSRYGNSNGFQSSDTLDANFFYGLHHGVSIKYNNLNERVFPTRGRNYFVNISHNLGSEDYTPGSTSDLVQITDKHSWLQMDAYYENYWPLKVGEFGVVANMKASTMDPFQNLNGTLLNTPAYHPTFESASLFLANFRSPFFLAGGIKYHLHLYRNLSFRTELHGFKPFFTWEENEGVVNRSRLSPEYHLAAMGSFIYKTPIGPISLSAHYYDDENPFFVLLNIGFLMFNQKPLE